MPEPRVPDDRVTRLLSLPSEELGQRQDELLEVVYQDLRVIAAGMFRREGLQHTLQPTAVVHEAWMKLGSQGVAVDNRGHFFAVAARAMRQVLVDHARRRGARKREAPGLRVTLDGELADERLGTELTTEVEMLELDRALTELSARFERQARVAELRYLVGLDNLRIAETLGVSEKTVRRDWHFARAWLQRELAGKRPPHP